ncbi:hypothetical protein CANINC_000989 [Pichia inconspicua]|uniref:Transcription initiation factor TFIID subunit 8 n=1 Tax=Pichia inconspicua TaxID=52247 RepID=A0A4T0X4W3_9ASCO|nr:hypothetical protein CANINC_000989 [[Candida] inconspicua]
MSETASSSTSSKASETLSIKMHDIPTELLERLLADFVQQINTVYRKRQGDIVIKDIDESIDFRSEVPRKRTLAELSRIETSTDIDDIIKKRWEFSDKELEKYGIPPTLVKNIPIEKSTTTDEPIADVLAASILEIMVQSIKSKFPDDDMVNVERSAISLMTRFVNLHFLNLSKRLQRLMEIQRRRLPNRDDLALLHREGIFDKSGIHDMYDLSKSWLDHGNQKKAQLLSSKAESALKSFNAPGPIDSVFLQNDEWWVDNIVERKKRKYYIPEWMPSLPPDYTYKATPKFNDRITDPIVLRDKLVNEGRIAELALDHIIARKPQDFDILVYKTEDKSGDDNCDTSSFSANDDMSTTESLVSPNIGDFEKVENKNIEATKSSNKVTDLVEYAKKRMQILDERRKKEEERIASRVNSAESTFGRNFGFYSKIRKLPDCINEELQNFRKKKLQELIRNIRKQEKFNNKWFEEQEVLRKRIAEEKSRYAEANEIELGTSVLNGENNLAFVNGDEEVDFDVEFSDMDDFTDSAVKPTEANSKERSETDNDSDNDNPTEFPNASASEEKMIEIATVNVSGKRPYVKLNAGPATNEISEVPNLTTDIPSVDLHVSEMDEEVDIDLDMFEEA